MRSAARRRGSSASRLKVTSGYRASNLGAQRGIAHKRSGRDDAMRIIARPRVAGSAERRPARAASRPPARASFALLNAAYCRPRRAQLHVVARLTGFSMSYPSGPGNARSPGRPPATSRGRRSRSDTGRMPAAARSQTTTPSTTSATKLGETTRSKNTGARLAGGQLLGNSVDAAAAVRAAEQALDAEHVMLWRVGRQPLADQLRLGVDAPRFGPSSSVYGSVAVPAKTKSVLKCIEYGIDCRRGARQRCRTAIALTSSAVTCSSSARST